MILSESWLDEQLAVFDERVVSAVDIDFKFLIAVPAKSQVVLPNIQVKRVKVLFEQKLFRRQMIVLACNHADAADNRPLLRHLVKKKVMVEALDPEVEKQLLLAACAFAEMNGSIKVTDLKKHLESKINVVLSRAKAKELGNQAMVIVGSKVSKPERDSLLEIKHEEIGNGEWEGCWQSHNRKKATWDGTSVTGQFD